MNDLNSLPFEPSYNEFCKAERISRVALYEMWKQGRGPRFYLNGRCRRITHKGRMEWQAEREAEAASSSQGEAA